jgi:hypothetical protein
MTDKPEEKKLFEPETNELNISRSRKPNFYIFLSKIIMKKFGNIELRALGQAADVCVTVADTLQRHNYANITKIYSQTIELEDDDRKRKGARLVVRLEKSDQFDKLTETFTT